MNSNLKTEKGKEPTEEKMICGGKDVTYHALRKRAKELKKSKG